MLRNRELFYGPTRTIDVASDCTCGGDEKFADIGDVVLVQLAANDKNRISARLWGGERAKESSIFGRVLTIFDVRHWDDDSNWSTDGSTLATNREEELWKTGLGALWYEWADKSASRTKTPLVQPGDCIAVLQPPVQTSSFERVVLVNRFERGVNERARYVFHTNVQRVRDVLGPRTSGKHTVARGEDYTTAAGHNEADARRMHGPPCVAS